ncbi:MAG: tetratricopeptide repeat protein [Balneolaceae bacterium]
MKRFFHMRPTYILLFVFFLAFAPNDARKANQAYEEGNYEEAIRLYQQAIDSDPENVRLHFNLGNALAHAGRTEEAVQAYEQFKSLTDDPKQKALADYNIGNLLSENEQYDPAIEAYRESLRLNPDDEDAKHNYELALKQKQEREQEEQDPERPDHPETDREDNQQGGDQDQSDGQPDFQNEPQDQDGNSSDSQPRMSREEAEKILNALQQREKELLEGRRKTSEEGARDGKDW